MERLVIKDADGNPYYYDAERGLKLESYEVTPMQHREVLERLHAYEDTGLTPEQIRELKERDTANKIELNAGVPICPVCGRKVAKCYVFCPDCGQRLMQ